MKWTYLISSFAGAALLLSSCVKDEVFSGPASLSNVAFTPAVPSSTDGVTVSAKVMDLKGVTSVTLNYRTSTTGTFTAVEMTAGSAPFMYTGAIPAEPMSTKVEYYVKVTNIEGFISLYPATAPAQLANYTVGASNVIKLYVNEVYSDGDATEPDWVEFYNGSDIAVDMSGYAFYDEGIRTSSPAKAKRILNAGTIIPSKGFLVQRTELTGGEYTVEFGLGKTGDAVYLENTSGVMVASLDFLTINLTGKKSYGRLPDGSDTWVTFTTPTRGASNHQ